MKKRLRKKRYLKEFAQYGFDVTANFNFDNYFNVSDKIDEVWDKIINFIESMGLCCGGSSSKTDIWFRVERYNLKKKNVYKSVTKEEKDKIINFLINIPILTNIEIGEWIDLWNSNNKNHNYKG